MKLSPDLPAIRERPGARLGRGCESVDLADSDDASSEEYGGMAMDLPVLMVTAERIGRLELLL